ncbi:MAG: 16S rRNA (adenine(1518)-N(6)/adenine(1519)-N(6))-dimethyltransferase, partial [Thermomicrobiales bacterium]|nr:16S rRNA (adenine(1518)-N(6)/adenine(1519)-N(6))-dimethyltransferase [Thermomicrobiales bacterium]
MTNELPPLPAGVRDWKALIGDLELQPSKGKGQNFLFDRNIVRRIVRTAGVQPG